MRKQNVDDLHEVSGDQGRGQGCPPAGARFGFYGDCFSAAEREALRDFEEGLPLAHEIALVRVVLTRLLDYLEGAEPEALLQVAPLTMQGAQTAARLLLQQRVLTGQAEDSLLGALELALRETNYILGVDR